MTEEEARKLIEPYVHYGRTNGQTDMVDAYDVITLLMEHCQSSKRLEEIRGKIGNLIFDERCGSNNLTAIGAYKICFDLFPPEQTKEGKI
jgi:hypothetical protein